MVKMVVIEARHANTGWWYDTRPTLSSGRSGDPGNGSDVRLGQPLCGHSPCKLGHHFQG